MPLHLEVHPATKARWATVGLRDIVLCRVPAACRAPRPTMKRSLICTDRAACAPTPGLSSMRTPISVGPEAVSD